MNLFATCQLAIHFEFTQVHDSCMTVQVQVADHASELGPNEPGIFVFESLIELPEKIHMTFSGKNMSKDTVCDQEGLILHDKCVIIQKITLDRFPVDAFYLKKKLLLQEIDSDRITHGNYIGFNGTMMLDLDCENVFYQIQKMSRMGRLDHAA